MQKMVRKLLSIAAALLLILLVVPAAFADQVFQDNFQTLDPAWANGAQVSAGIFTLKAQQGLDYIDLYDSFVFRNMDASADACVQNFSAGGLGQAALCFWAADINNDYELVFGENGYISVAQRVAGKHFYVVN